MQRGGSPVRKGARGWPLGADAARPLRTALSWPQRPRLRGCKRNSSIKTLVKTLSSTIPQSASRTAPFTQRGLLAFFPLQANPSVRNSRPASGREALSGAPLLTGLPPPQKAQSKAERREGACNRAAEAQRRPFAERRSKGATRRRLFRLRLKSRRSKADFATTRAFHALSLYLLFYFHFGEIVIDKPPYLYYTLLNKIRTFYV